MTRHAPIPAWRNPLLDRRSFHSPRCRCAICAPSTAQAGPDGDDAGHPPTDTVTPRPSGPAAPFSAHREDPRP